VFFFGIMLHQSPAPILAALLLILGAVRSTYGATSSNVAFVSRSFYIRHYHRSEYVQPQNLLSKETRYPSSVLLHEMKRPILDQIATTLFQLETNRVKASSIVDDRGRLGEPMEWSEDTSIANRFSELIAKNSIGYNVKQWIANIIAGDYDEEKIEQMVDDFIGQHDVAMFSFTTCPFCRRAKDILEEQNIKYVAMELDELNDNLGNEIRALLGKKTKRTSMPNIFIRGQCIGGCNDGYPGLLPLLKTGELSALFIKKYDLR
jgi:glutaredoxin 3